MVKKSSEENSRGLSYWLAVLVEWGEENLGAICYWLLAPNVWVWLVGKGVLSLSLPPQAVAFVAGGLGVTAADASLLVSLGLVVLPALLIYAGLTAWYHSIANTDQPRIKAMIEWGRYTCVLVPLIVGVAAAISPVTWPVLLGVATAPFAMMLLRAVWSMIHAALRPLTFDDLSNAINEGSAKQVRHILQGIELDEEMKLEACFLASAVSLEILKSVLDGTKLSINTVKHGPFDAPSQMTLLYWVVLNYGSDEVNPVRTSVIDYLLDHDDIGLDAICFYNPGAIAEDQGHIKTPREWLSQKVVGIAALRGERSLVEKLVEKGALNPFFLKVHQPLWVRYINGEDIDSILGDTEVTGDTPNAPLPAPAAAPAPAPEVNRDLAHLLRDIKNSQLKGVQLTAERLECLDPATEYQRVLVPAASGGQVAIVRKIMKSGSYQGIPDAVKVDACAKASGNQHRNIVALLCSEKGGVRDVVDTSGRHQFSIFQPGGEGGDGASLGPVI